MHQNLPNQPGGFRVPERQWVEEAPPPFPRPTPVLARDGWRFPEALRAAVAALPEEGPDGLEQPGTVETRQEPSPAELSAPTPSCRIAVEATWGLSGSLDDHMEHLLEVLAAEEEEIEIPELDPVVLSRATRGVRRALQSARHTALASAEIARWGRVLFYVVLFEAMEDQERRVQVLIAKGLHKVSQQVALPCRSRSGHHKVSQQVALPCRSRSGHHKVSQQVALPCRHGKPVKYRPSFRLTS